MSANINEEDFKNIKYKNAYSEELFWDKIIGVGKKIGAKGVYFALLLYYVLLKENVPYNTKMLIVGAIGYLIFPVDLIPDFILAAGFTDDIAALIFVVHKINSYIDDEVREQAKNKIQDLFNLTEQEIKSFG